MYYQTKVQFKIEDEKGKVKKQTVTYLVDAMSPTEAEARTTKFLSDNGENEFEVIGANQSKISSVIS